MSIHMSLFYSFEIYFIVIILFAFYALYLCAHWMETNQINKKVMKHRRNRIKNVLVMIVVERTNNRQANEVRIMKQIRLLL